LGDAERVLGANPEGWAWERGCKSPPRHGANP
jgi:hypothetical protein